MSIRNSYINKCIKVLKAMYHELIHLEKVSNFYTSIIFIEVSKFCEAFLLFQFQFKYLYAPFFQREYVRNVSGNLLYR